MIVADTNLVVYLLLNGDYTIAAEAARAKDRQWLVPSLFRHEFLNVLTTYVRTGRLTRDAALRVHRRGLALVHFADVEAKASDVFNLALRGGCAAYDAEFVWLAMEFAIKLVTTDRAIIKAFPDVVVDIEEFSSK